MPQNSVTHIYGIAGIIPGLIGLGLAWGVDSPWSEYALMASGWLAAIMYAVLIWKIIRRYNNYATESGIAHTTIENLQKEIRRLKSEHAAEMEQRAGTMEFLAGIAMGRRPIPRANTKDEVDSND